MRYDIFEYRASGNSLDICGNLPQGTVMSKSIRLSDSLFGQAQKMGELYHRSPPQQIEYWAKLGRVMESTLSWPVIDKVVTWGQENDIDDLINEVGSGSGREKAKKIIVATSCRK